MPFLTGIVLGFSVMVPPAWTQGAPPSAVAPTSNTNTPASQSKPAENLYMQLSSVGLDTLRVFRLRDVSIDRAAFHITLNDGLIAFTENVANHVTGAFFEGDGEILLSPPNRYERASMALFTGEAILEERFVTGYFRFNDDTFADMRPSLEPVEHAEAFLSQWNETARNLAEDDALRLLMTFSKFLPIEGRSSEGTSPALDSVGEKDRFLHARLQGLRLGTFDIYFDADAPEKIWAGQLKTVEGSSYYDVWTSFSSAEANRGTEAVNAAMGESGKPDSIAISHYTVRTKIKPPIEIDAEALMQMEVRQGGERAVLFELSRSLRITEVEADGHPVEFIHNPEIEGTQLARRGNDLVAVIFPQPLRTAQRLELRFVYGGAVLSEAGAGLLYVGARGTWYPNRGLAMSNFDLEFRYPAGWTLVATGERTDTKSGTSVGETLAPGEQVSRWVSQRPIPLAGFDLGKYERVVAHAGDVSVETYATAGMERGFPKPPLEAVLPPVVIGGIPRRPSLTIAPLPPSPAKNAQVVANTSAHAIEFFSRRYGPYPYADLKVAQMPGGLSQGWPGLIFLSSTSFLTAEEKSELHMSPVEKTLISQIIAHETAHQWWGDLVMWSGYRDQWLVEALANYSSMMILESENPAQFRAAMEKYRDDLLQKNKAGAQVLEDGPVTLGTRLSNSQFPEGYEVISYGRGTWLFHMLRSMMRDAERTDDRTRSAGQADESFVRVLHRIRERYEGKAITTRELLQAFEDELPPSLRYERHKSLDWFYEGWVNGTTIPRFELRGVKYAEKAGSTAISGTILQRDAPDDLVTSVPLYVLVAGKMVLLARVFADGPETSFHLTAPQGARKVVLDPEQTLLARSR
ncbi:MAG TPA: M1 family aminopeptidase [Terriglobales bacterium]|nr:M1 family aminopeptidase [Terriglobales bacterium]